MMDELSARRQLIDESLTPWFEDPREIARLLRWLELVGETPNSIPDFIESAQTWERQREEMRVWAP